MSRRLSLLRNQHRLHRFFIAASLSAKSLFIRIKDFPEYSFAWYLNMIFIPLHRCKVCHDHQLLFRCTASSNKCNGAGLRMVTVHPFKSHHIKIIVIQGIVFFIQTVPLTDIVLHLTVAYILIQQKPIQATVLCPFRFWANSCPMNKSFLPGWP